MGLHFRFTSVCIFHMEDQSAGISVYLYSADCGFLIILLANSWIGLVQSQHCSLNKKICKVCSALQKYLLKCYSSCLKHWQKPCRNSQQVFGWWFTDYSKCTLQVGHLLKNIFNKPNLPPRHFKCHCKQLTLFFSRDPFELFILSVWTFTFGSISKG